MSQDLERRNNALALNPSILNGVTAGISSTTHGSDVYFAICAVMGTTALVVLALAAKKPRQDRIFFYITAAINATACVAYFTMGSNLGFAPIEVEFHRANPKVHGNYRQIFYARYVDWVITTPLLLTDLMLTAALPWPTILWTIFLDEVMIITGLIGALVTSRYKFGYFAIGCAAMFAVFYELAINGRKHAKALGKDVYRVYLICGVLTLFMWMLYPVAWGVCEGGNVIAPDSEAVFYGILDCIAKPVFSAALIAGHWNISPGRLGLQIREYPFEGNDDQKHVNEKQGEANNNNNGADSNGDSANNSGSNGIVPSYADVGSPNATHAAHTHGYTPTHEGVTTEGGLHSRTAQRTGDVV